MVHTKTVFSCPIHIIIRHQLVALVTSTVFLQLCNSWAVRFRRHALANRVSLHAILARSRCWKKERKYRRNKDHVQGAQSSYTPMTKCSEPLQPYPNNQVLKLSPLLKPSNRMRLQCPYARSHRRESHIPSSCQRACT